MDFKRVYREMNAIQVTEENVAAVSVWCCKVSVHDEIGNWIVLREDGSFKAYTPEQFEMMYSTVENVTAKIAERVAKDLVQALSLKQGEVYDVIYDIAEDVAKNQVHEHYNSDHGDGY